MSLPLTTEMLEQAYEFLRTTPPFSRWNLPDGEDVAFRVVRSPLNKGWYKWDGKRHVIAMSRRCIGHTDSLMQVMAHEMIHLHEENARACGAGEHSAAFDRWAEQVCKVHGWDVKGF